MQSIDKRIERTYRKTVTRGHYAPTARVRALFLEFEKIYGITAMNFIRRETVRGMGRRYIAAKIGVTGSVIKYAQYSMGIEPPPSKLRPERSNGKIAIQTQLKLDGIFSVYMYDMVRNRMRRKGMTYAQAVEDAKNAIPRTRNPDRKLRS